MRPLLCACLALAACGTAAAHGERDGDLYASSGVFGGAMILEIAASGGDGTGVEVGGEPGRMVRAADGSWRAYVADASAARALDAATGIPGTGLDFGIECAPGFLGSAVPAFTSGDGCGASVSPGHLHVLNGAGAPAPGQGFDPDHWPFIQLFDFAGGHGAAVTHGDLRVDAEYDARMWERASLLAGPGPRASGGDVMIAIRDGLLNVDPTNEDTWTFDVRGGQVYGCIFDETGSVARINGTVVEVDPALIYHYGDALDGAGVGPSGRLAASGSVQARDNALQDSAQLPTIAGSLVTVRETGKNSGAFTNVDRLGAANLVAGGGFALEYGGSEWPRPADPPPAESPLQRTPLTNLRVLDHFGNVIDSAHEGMQVLVASDLVAWRGMELTYVLRIEGPGGEVASLSSVKGRLGAGQALPTEVSWTAGAPGDYVATASAWETPWDGRPYAPPTTVGIRVHP